MDDQREKIMAEIILSEETMNKATLYKEDISAPPGRPTKYKPEFCEVVIEKMKEGAAIEELPYYLDVCTDTIYEWAKVHPEFSDSLKIGRNYSRAVWMNWGRKNLRDEDFNYTGWYMNMKNRFGWRDKIESDHQVNLKESDNKVRNADEQYEF